MSNNMLTASRVANELNISVKTLTNWYKWFNDDSIEKPQNYPHLPMYIQKTERSPRLWKYEDITQLKEFQNWIPRGRHGVMGKISCKYWTKKGSDKNE